MAAGGGEGNTKVIWICTLLFWTNFDTFTFSLFLWRNQTCNTNQEYSVLISPYISLTITYLDPSHYTVYTQTQQQQQQPTTNSFHYLLCSKYSNILIIIMLTNTIHPSFPWYCAVILPSLGAVLWWCQACTEMVMPFCYDGVKDFFEPAPWDFQEYADNCEKTWGVMPRSYMAVLMYGGWSFKAASNIVFRCVEGIFVLILFYI